ncbi:MAG: hypothetical protein HYY37_01270 [Candidatus Aenigmarchaeota archaeon]|nr:hypothetical protein [Candidatus Aenigmarchaeota archaeon]
MTIPKTTLYALIFLISISSISFAECVYSADVYLDTIAISEGKKSLYQAPELREDDSFFIKNLGILNTGNCTLVRPRISIQLDRAGPGPHLFCSSPYTYGILIDYNLTPKSYYEFHQISPEKPWEYVDNNNKENYCSGTLLNETKRFEIIPTLYVIEPEIPESYSSNFYINGELTNAYSYRVFTKYELETRSPSLLSIWIAILIPLIVLLADIIYRRRKHTECQINFLHALALEVERIQRDSRGFDELLHMNERRDIEKGKRIALIIPQYPIKNLNSAFYVRSLDNAIKGKSTEKLKDALISVSDKIWLVNDSLRRLSNREARWEETMVYYMRIDNRFQNQIKGHYKVDLDKAIEDTLISLQSF